MRLQLCTVALLSSVGLITACDVQEAAPRTNDLTRSLLTVPAADGASTSALVAPTLFQNVPDLSVMRIGYNRGSSEAPLKIIELSDYGCGYCRRFHQETFPTLLAEFVESGMIEWKFVPYITGMFENSLSAAKAAECTYQQDNAAFETLSARLWRSQADWKGSGDPDPLLRDWVSELEIDLADFDACLANDEGIERIAAATSIARSIGVRGTPTFLPIGYAPLQGALPLEVFRELFTAMHADLVSRSSGEQTSSETPNGASDN